MVLRVRRAIRKLHPAHRNDIADLKTWTPLPAADLQHLNPFLLLNHHGRETFTPNNNGLPFTPHPHRGFETVTFVVEGELLHRDTAGHESIIRAGGIQWMTAGSGLVHEEISSEDFKRSGGPLEILQLWVNLPAKLKMSAPAYRGLEKTEIPSFAENGCTVHLISGSWEGHQGPIQSLSDVHLMQIDFTSGARTALQIGPARQIFFYVVRGSLKVNGTLVQHMNLVEFEEVGETIALEASETCLILFGHAPVLNEPIAARGPFVMNTLQEIMTAMQDYQSGKIK